MRHIKRSGVVVLAGVLSVGVLTGLKQPATAAPDAQAWNVQWSQRADKRGPQWNKKRDNDRGRNNNRRRDRDRRDRNRRNVETYIGEVEGVRSARGVDIRINGRSYNVFTNTSLPRGLRRGDTVRVSGERTGSNNIVNATITVIRRR